MKKFIKVVEDNIYAKDVVETSVDYLQESLEEVIKDYSDEWGFEPEDWEEKNGEYTAEYEVEGDWDDPNFTYFTISEVTLEDEIKTLEDKFNKDVENIKRKMGV